MRRHRFLLIAAVAAAFFFACGSEEPDDDTTDTGTEDTGGDDTGGDDVGTEDTGGEDTGGEDSGGDTGEADADTGDDGCEIDRNCPNGSRCIDGECVLQEATPCDLQEDCPRDRVCTGGMCEPAPRCGSYNDWARCVDRVDELEAGLGRYATCVDNRACLPLCTIDADCHDGDICSDWGQCRPYTGTVTGEHPGGDARADLQVGYSNVLLNFPIGVPMGGYGERAAYNDGRYAVSLRASIGTFHGLYAQAIAIDNGERQMVFVSLPMVFTGMAFFEQVAQALQEETGRDWRDSLVINSSHTHSGPARIWQVPDDAAADIGTFGIGEFSQEVFDWLHASVADAVLEAVDNLEPGRFGWEIVEAFDTDDRVASDRWDQSPPYDDNRMLLWRFEDAEGDLTGMMMSYGTHGTDNGSDYFTNDAIHGAEHTLEELLGEREGREIHVQFMNQNGGTMSPRGGEFGHAFPHNHPRLGYTLWETIIDDFDAIETSTDIELEAVTYRFPISYDLIGYERNEWAGDLDPPVGGEYNRGAISCGAENGGDTQFDTFMNPAQLFCVSIAFLAHNRTPSIFMKSQVTAMNVGGLIALTAPGELSMEVGWLMLRELEEDWGLDPLEAWTFGYSQDHLLYIMPNNMRGELPPFPGVSTPQPFDDYPDQAYGFLQGGYETTLAPWGWRFSDYLVERVSDAYGMLMDSEFEPRVPHVLPQEFTPFDQEPFEIDLTDASEVGVIKEDVPETVTRFDLIEFSWQGGDPGAEMPQTPLVTLEYEEEDGSWVTPMTAAHRPYTNREALMMTRLRQRGRTYDWVVRWEELKDFPLGNYRFRINGHYQESEGAGGRMPYEAFTSEFELVPTDGVVITGTASTSEVSGTLGYPPSERLVFLELLDDPGSVIGSYRMRHPQVGTGIPDPLVSEDDLVPAGVTVRVLDGDTEIAVYTGEDVVLETFVGDRDGRQAAQTRYTVTFEDGDVVAGRTIEVLAEDLHGNTGFYTVTVE